MTYICIRVRVWVFFFLFFFNTVDCWLYGTHAVTNQSFEERTWSHPDEHGQ